MKNFLFIILPMLFLTLLFNACQKDACSNKTCHNGGTCLDGQCQCLSGYSGSNCQDYDLCHNVICYNNGTCFNGQCQCPSGYGGSNCATVLTPTSVRITRIDLINYPVVKDNGASWDFSSGADPFFVFHLGTSTSYTQNDFISGYYNNVTGQGLSFAGISIIVHSLYNTWALDLWDYDSTSSHDLMGSIHFKPIDYVNNFPTVIELKTAKAIARLRVIWNF